MSKDRKRVQPFSKTLLILLIVIIAIIFALLIDFGHIKIPEQFSQRTGDNQIYQTLFMAQASMVGIVFAVIALLMSVAKARVYGLSVIQYVMNIRPIFILRHKNILIAVIIIISINWFFIALNLNNMSVVMFVVSTFLILITISDVLYAIQLKQDLENEIKDYILNSGSGQHTKDLFNEIKESIISGNAIMRQRDIAFAKELAKNTIMNSPKNTDTNDFQNLLATVINTVNEAQNLKVEDILDLYVSTVEFANKKGALEFRCLTYRDTLGLLEKASRLNLMGSNYYWLLKRWYEAVLTNASNSDEFQIASDMYQHAFKNNIEKSEKIAIEILKITQSAIKNPNLVKLAEYNYLNLIITLFKERDEKLLNTLFGFDGTIMSANFEPLINTMVYFSLNKCTIFIMIYLYYLSFLESIVSDEERAFCKSSLQKLSEFFCMQVLRDRDSFKNLIRDNYSFFVDILSSNERHGPFNYGWTTFKLSVAKTAVLEYLIFIITHLTNNADEISEIFRILDRVQPKGRDAIIYPSFERYVCSNVPPTYEQFVSILPDYTSDTAEDVYATLKDVVIDLCRQQKIKEAEENNKKFSAKKNDYEKLINIHISEEIAEYCSKFSSFENGENYESYTLKSIEEFQVHNGKLDNYCTEELCADLIKNISDCFFCKIKEHLKLTESNYDSAASDLLSNVSQMNDLSIILGHKIYTSSDTNALDKYKSIEQKCLLFSLSNNTFTVAINSKLVKLNISNFKAVIRNLSVEEINKKIADKNVMSEDGHKIPLDQTTSVDYLQKQYRIIEVSLEISIKCTCDIVGGGISYNHTPS